MKTIGIGVALITSLGLVLVASRRSEATPDKTTPRSLPAERSSAPNPPRDDYKRTEERATPHTRDGPDPLVRSTRESAYAEIAIIEDDGRRRSMLDRTFQKWVQQDAAGSADFVLTLANEEQRKESMAHLMQAWATQEPSAALSWSAKASFDNDYERQVAMSIICAQVARTDPVEALKLALEHKLDESPDGPFEGLAARWAETDLEAANEWALSMPPGIKRDRVLGSVAWVMADQAPEQSTRLILDQIPAGEARTNALLAVIDRLALQDRERARRLTDTLPGGELRDRARKNLDAFASR